MFSYRLKTVGGILLFCLLYAVSGVPLYVLRNDYSDKDMWLLGFVLWLAWGLVLLGPVSFAIIRRVWFFPSRREPVRREVLEEALMDVNALRGPVRARKKRGGDIHLTWKYDDQGWWECLMADDRPVLPELRLSLDPRTRTVTIRDMTRKVDWSIAPNRVRLSMAMTTPFFRFTEDPDATVLHRLNDPPSRDFRFSRENLKDPVCNTILNSGWNIRFSL